jgi:hypothetical protein
MSGGAPPDGVAVRDGVVLVVVELPDVGERAERHVELAAGPLADLAGRAQRFAHVGAGRHRVLPAAALIRSTSLPEAPHAHQRVEPVELREHRVERRPRRGFVGSPRRQAQFRPHRHTRALDEVRRRRRAHVLPAGGDGSYEQHDRHKPVLDEPQRA